MDKLNMGLTEIEKEAITSSFILINHQEQQFATLFYDCLFDLAPLIKPMFKRDRKLIEEHFYMIFCAAVDNIHHLDTIRAILLELGARHRNYGVKVSHFPIVKSALILAIQHELKGQSNASIENAWSNYYDVLAAIILEGMLADKIA